jgi:hypothetical protein
MSFLSGITNFLGGVGNFFKANPLVGSLAKTALSAYALNRLTASINKESASANKAVDPGTELQLDPDPENKIPVVYGQSTIGGNITDVYLADDNLSLWVCLTLSEKTGNLINGTPSVITFDKIYMDGFEIKFKADGITANYLVDVESNQDTRVNDLIQVYCYNAGSAGQVFPTSYTGSATSAISVFPSWDNNKTMSNLVFAIVKIKYNADKNIRSVPDFRFTLINSMTKPGDVLYDMMTNTRYGAGILAAEINS